MPSKSNNIWVVSHKYHLIQVYTFFYHSFAVKKYLEKWYSKTYLSVFFHSKRFPQKSFPKMRRMHMILIFLKSITNLQPPTYSINFHTSSEKNFEITLLWKSTFSNVYELPYISFRNATKRFVKFLMDVRKFKKVWRKVDVQIAVKVFLEVVWTFYD